MNSRFKKSKRVRKKSKIFINKNNINLFLKTFSTLICIFIFIMLLNHIASFFSNKIIFENEMEKFYQLNSQKIFTIDEINLYNSANAKQNTDIKKSFILDIYQFTDISFYITNKKNIIVREFYIDNISCSTDSQNSNTVFIYKNPLEFGKLNKFDINMSERIDFKVLDNNANTDFSVPYVYNNLSNPITLEYINANVLENFNAGLNNVTIEYNGKLLRIANISPDRLNANIYFNINIFDINNNFYTCRVHIPIDLSKNNYSIYDGESLEKINNTNLYTFLNVK